MKYVASFGYLFFTEAPSLLNLLFYFMVQNLSSEKAIDLNLNLIII